MVSVTMALEGFFSMSYKKREGSNMASVEMSVDGSDLNLGVSFGAGDQIGVFNSNFTNFYGDQTNAKGVDLPTTDLEVKYGFMAINDDGNMDYPYLFSGN